MHPRTTTATVTISALLIGTAMIATCGCAQTTSTGTSGADSSSLAESTPKVPADFGVPIYPNSKKTGFRKGDGVDTAFLTTPDSLTTVADWYQGLVKSGWTLRGEPLRDAQHAVIAIEKGAVTGTANIWKGPEGTDIQLHHQH